MARLAGAALVHKNAKERILVRLGRRGAREALRYVQSLPERDVLIDLAPKDSVGRGVSGERERNERERERERETGAGESALRVVKITRS
jgi:hypothetical protein